MHRRKHRRHSREAQYEVAYVDLLTRDGRKRTSNMRKEAGNRIVTRLSDAEWLVKGGYCEHRVTRQNGRVICTDHEPAHKRKDGHVCCHELAVYKTLAWERIPDLFTSEGVRK